MKTLVRLNPGIKVYVNIKTLKYITKPTYICIENSVDWVLMTKSEAEEYIAEQKIKKETQSTEVKTE